MTSTFVAQSASRALGLVIAKCKTVGGVPRFFLGVGKYTPNAAVLGEMGWIPPSIRQWTSNAAFWSRMVLYQFT